MADAMKLLPCPVCDANAEIVSDGAKPDDGYRFVRCTSVASCEETGWLSSESEAVEAWNRRASPPAREEAPERRECIDCGFKGTSEQANPEQDYCTSCEENSPVGGPDECSHCGAKNHMVMACPICGGRFALDEDAREEAPAEVAELLAQRLEAIARAVGGPDERAALAAGAAALRNRTSEPEARMWPESEGEIPRCTGCGGSSRYWHGENRLWNLVMGGPAATDDPGGIMCPNCFIDRAAAQGLRRRWIVSDVDPDATSEPEAGAVPKAWIWRDTTRLKIGLTLSLSEAEQRREAGCEIEPLWTHPAPATADKLRVAIEALERIKDLGSDGEHSGDRHARCRDFAHQALTALNEQPQ